MTRYGEGMFRERRMRQTMARVKAPSLLPAIVFCLCTWFAVPCATAEDGVLGVRPGVGRDVGGYTELQRVFGMMCGGNIRQETVPEIQRLVQDIDVNAVRAIFNGWISQLPRTYSAWYGRDRPTFATWEQS